MQSLLIVFGQNNPFILGYSNSSKPSHIGKRFVGKNSWSEISYWHIDHEVSEVEFWCAMRIPTYFAGILGELMQCVQKFYLHVFNAD